MHLSNLTRKLWLRFRGRSGVCEGRREKAAGSEEGELNFVVSCDLEMGLIVWLVVMRCAVSESCSEDVML